MANPAFFNVYSAHQEDKLVTEGVYSNMCHHQYTGIYLALFGKVIHWPNMPTLVLFPIMVWISALQKGMKRLY